MAKDYDATLKHIVDPRPDSLADSLRTKAPLPDGPATLVDADLSTVVQPEADKLLRVGDALALVEFLANPPDAVSRFLSYLVLGHHRLSLPISAFLLLLRPAADHPSLTGEYAVPEAGGTAAAVRFRYHAIRVWEEDPAALLAGPLFAVPLVPLTDAAAADPEGWLHRVRERFVADAEPGPELANLWNGTQILMGLRYSKRLAAQLCRRVGMMRESSVYQLILEE